MESGASGKLANLDLNTCDNLNEGVLNKFMSLHGPQLTGLNLAGHHKLTENFWAAAIPHLPHIK